MHAHRHAAQRLREREAAEHGIDRSFDLCGVGESLRRDEAVDA
jgi:hypothetical protein